MADQDKKKNKTPLWRHWPRHKVLYALHWAAWISVSWALWTGRFPYTERGSATALHISIAAILGTFGSYFFWAMVLDSAVLRSKLLGFIFFPVKAIFMPFSFLWEAFKTYRKARKAIPYRSGYFTLLLLALSVAFLDDNHARLHIAECILWPLLFATLLVCLKWTLNPVSFLNKLESLWGKIFSHTNESAIGDAVKKGKTIKGALGSLSQSLKAVSAFAALGMGLGQLLRSPVILLSIFLGVFLSVLSISIAIFSAIFRIRHVVSPGGVFASGPFFQDRVMDYFYFSLREFSGMEAHGVSVIGNGIMTPLLIFSATHLFLMFVVVLTFSSVTQRVADETADSYADKLKKQAEGLFGGFNEAAVAQSILQMALKSGAFKVTTATAPKDIDIEGVVLHEEKPKDGATSSPGIKSS